MSGDVPAADGAPRSLRRRVGDLLSWGSVAAGSAGSRALSFLASVIVARALGPAGFGDFSIFFALMIVFSTATEFVDVTYVRHATAPGRDPAAVLRAALALKLVIVAILAALAFPLALLLAHAVFDRPDLVQGTALAILSGLGIGLVSLRASTYLAARRYVPFAAVGSAFYVGIVLVLLPIWIADAHLGTGTTYWIFFGSALAVGLPALATLVLAARPLRVERAELRRMVHFAGWLFAANVLYVLFGRLDVIVLARYAPQAEVGQYGAGLRITVVVSLFIGALSGFLLPRVGGARVSRSTIATYLRDTRFFSLLLAAAVAAVWVATPWLVRGFFGAEYAEAIPLARIVLLGTFLLSLSAPLSQLLLGAEVPRALLFLNGTRLASILGLTLVLAPRHGATGVAWAYVATEAVALAYVAVAAAVVWRRTPLVDSRAAATPAPDAAGTGGTS